ncbi:hypothetical protein RclHR1_09050011 [Rhizophagus clarus]|uniref:Plectin-like isoform X1 n=1 Tax=Rhizophagus clarus TaxID=94130 RepID=A0A2Z6S5B7_9GLOM|nr:hypothetical protein RclHR1_09050011 [Rhizophagus clarus]GES88803.1 plectin-like isoform X1 [Rhizophagus clarus]
MRTAIVKERQQTSSTFQQSKLCNWISKKPQLLKVQPGIKRLNIRVKPKYPALETALVTWVKEKRKNQNAVTRSIIQIKAQTLAQQCQWQVMCSGIRSFRFSNKWLDGFMSQNKLSNRHRTTIAQHLPENLIKK